MAKSVKRWWWAASAAAVLVGGVAVAQAHARGPFGHHVQSAEELRERLDHGAERLLDFVDASDSQAGAVDALVEQKSPALYAILEEGRGLREQLKAALLAEKLDEAHVAALRSELKTWSAKAVDAATETLAQVSRELTPEQRAKLSERMAWLGR
jgi:Spy/CpxP family protein refolding chaperone